MRIVSAQEAVSGIKSGQQIFMQGSAATPSVLLDALVARAPELEDVKIVHMHIEGPAPHLRPEMAGHFCHRALFMGANARAAVNEGRAEFIPVFLSEIPLLFERGVLPLDACLINVTPPDEHGFCSLGTAVDTVITAVRCGKTIIAQLNKSMPRTLGDSFVHVSKIDYGVEVDVPPYDASPTRRSVTSSGASASTSPTSSRTRPRSRWASAPSPAPSACTSIEKRDLGVHTEMFTDVLVDLVEPAS